jgi:preprotein translocase subunit SecE
MAKSKKNPKKRKPKGKLLSESLKERDDARASETSEADEEGEEDELASQPPPETSFEDEHEEDEAEEEEHEEEDAAAKGSGEFEDEAEGPAAEDEEREPRAAAADGDDAAPPVSSVRGEADEYEDEEEGARAMGYRRYIIAAWFGLWVVTSYIVGRIVEGGWQRVASKDWVLRSKNAFLRFLVTVDPDADRELLNRHTVSLLVGALLAGAVVLRYYSRPDVRTWADEVADELSKVKWPTRKDVGNNTLVVIVASAVLTFYLLLLDRFWGFVTNLIYSAGV